MPGESNKTKKHTPKGKSKKVNKAAKENALPSVRPPEEKEINASRLAKSRAAKHKEVSGPLIGDRKIDEKAENQEAVPAVNGSIIVGAGKKKIKPLLLGGLALMTLLVSFEVLYLIKAKVERHRELELVNTFGKRGNQEAGDFLGTFLAEIDYQDRLYLIDDNQAKVVVWAAQSGKFLFELTAKIVQDESFVPADVDAAPTGEIFVLDKKHSQIYSFSPTGKFLRKWPAENGKAICVEQDGSILICGHNHIIRYDQEGKKKGRVGSQGAGKEMLKNPYRMDVDKKGNIYVLDNDEKSIKIFSSTGKGIKMFKVNYKLSSLTDIHVKDGEVFMNDFSGGFVWIYSKKGKLICKIKIAYVSAFAIDKEGYFYSPGPHGMGRYMQKQRKLF